jgi:hypothetical protein
MATVPCRKLYTEYWTTGSVLGKKKKEMKTLTKDKLNNIDT